LTTQVAPQLALINKDPSVFAARNKSKDKSSALASGLKKFSKI
jgi:hypothetical protein